MTTQSAELSARSGVSNRSDRAVRGEALVIDLDADHPPEPPARVRWMIQSIRFPANLGVWIKAIGHDEGKTFNAVVVELLTRARREQPADVRDWLMKQAAQCGCPGDVDQALTLVVRHLAERWPNGGRLR